MDQLDRSAAAPPIGMPSARSAERRSAFELVVGSGISALLATAFLIYSARKLGPAAYADVSAALAFLYFFGVAFSPISATISRFVARFAARGEQEAIGPTHRRLHAFLTRWCVVGALLMAALTPLLRRALSFRSSGTLLLAIVCVAGYLFVSVDRSVLQGMGRYREFNASVVFETLVRLLAAIAFLQWRPTALVAMGSYAGAILTAGVLLRIRFRREPRGSAEGAPFGELARFAGPMLLLMIAFSLFQNADVLVVKRWLPAVDAGLYSAAAALARVFAVLVTPLQVLAMPLLTSMHERGERTFAASLRLCGYFLLISALPLTVAILAPGFLVDHLYGPQFHAAAPLLGLLSGVAVINGLGLLLTQALASRHSFTFLGPYLALALVQLVALATLHDSFAQIIGSLFAVQGAVLVMLLLFSWHESRRPASGRDGRMART